MKALQPLFNFVSCSLFGIWNTNFALLIYFGAAPHVRDFLGLSVKTKTESIGHQEKCDNLIIEIQFTQIGK